MKKIFLVVALVISLLTGCAETPKESAPMVKDNPVVEESATPEDKRCFVTFEIKQSHFTLDLFEHAKDSMNAIEIEIPVDREFYNEVKVGQIINDEFRTGSFIMHGSFGSWKVSVKNKIEK